MRKEVEGAKNEVILEESDDNEFQFNNQNEGPEEF